MLSPAARGFPLSFPSALWCRFDVRGEGQCAYIDGDGVSSARCSQEKYSVCSHAQKPALLGFQKASQSLNFT